VVSNIFYFSFHIWGAILPIDELIFFKMVIAPPTSCEHILFDSLLVGGLEPWNFMTFHSVGNVIIPTDELHHFSDG